MCGSQMASLYSNIVWTTSAEHSTQLEAMSDEDFAEAVNRALNDDYSPPPPSQIAKLVPSILPSPLSLFAGGPREFEPPPRVTGAVGKRLSFPLSLSFTGKYVLPRMALVGDAAHTVHPLAGQGVNLGFLDAAALARVIGNGIKDGREIGDLLLLEEYQAERQKENLRMIAALHALQRVFCTQNWPLPLLRNIGLDAVQILTPVKNRIMSYAMGLQGWK
ncbi:hypothetical protein CBR_g34017 [Chara braunii]|uniref:FAD-binding domain-containing protein n=1 Tax=Chara braunii TaxID=69332 RepID=A0A388LHN9_CHABU|nr:hypothetical protein CBR_g34017 [Chara braunii]|eukprot:GBG81836.1 hypothetical protein CBR_g34017 [Chara braunii]